MAYAKRSSGVEENYGEEETIMSRGLMLTAAGLALGLVAALGLSGLIGSLLYKVKPWDPASLALAFLVMALVAGAACLLPAWRAARTDPVRTLHE